MARPRHRRGVDADSATSTAVLIFRSAPDAKCRSDSEVPRCEQMLSSCCVAPSWRATATTQIAQFGSAGGVYLSQLGGRRDKVRVQGAVTYLMRAPCPCTCSGAGRWHIAGSCRPSLAQARAAIVATRRCHEVAVASRTTRRQMSRSTRCPAPSTPVVATVGRA